MNKPLAEEYLRWLAPQIREEHESSDSEYEGLARIMFEKEYSEEYARLVPNDDNRLADGLDLRNEFCYANHITIGSLRNLGPCSFLEVLIGLSRRLEFAAGGSARGWAWVLVGNLELHKMKDPLSRRKARMVEDILDVVIHRTYAPDGSGGFFPLAWPDEDQTRIELWYQMMAYIDELHPEH